MTTLKKKQLKLTPQEFAGSGWLTPDNSAYVEDLFNRYLDVANHAHISQEWKNYFEKIVENSKWSQLAHPVSVERIQHDASSNTKEEHKLLFFNLSMQLLRLIENFRTNGHFQAQLDPLGLAKAPEAFVLLMQDVEFHEVANTTLPMQGQLGFEAATPNEILARLKSIYCGSIGFEYTHMTSREEKDWLIKRIESIRTQYSPDIKKRILHRLLESEGLEKHLGSQFVAQKRFSIEGTDTLMPMLDSMTLRATEQGIKSLVIGMAHRGRLNVLYNWCGKDIDNLSKEFAGAYHEEDVLSGDVKYHKGFKNTLKTPHGEMSIELAFNPSHLEIVNPVVEGIARAKQEQFIENGEHNGKKVLPILIHGDAAVSGQGIVMETLQLSQTPAYQTGGTIHIVLNNQVGFTTDPNDSRSTYYCTDIAKMIDVPIFHVNASDPEAACWIINLALDYRMHFQKDVFIDLIGYRRYGHNEADEPAATQPIMYQTIRAKKPIWFDYAQTLRAEGAIQAGEAETWLSDYRKRVKQGGVIAPFAQGNAQALDEETESLSQDWRSSAETAVATNQIKDFAEPLTALPQNMILQPQVARLIADRKKMIEGELLMNWGTAETLAYATLLSEGFKVRLSGQDTERGTFAHRHAVLHDYKTDASYTPLQKIAQSPMQFSIYDSILSEAATMGFEYGYATTLPKALVIWEAQYGDFVNGAQLIIDQFLSASEKKWGQSNGLVLFLPHGYEGSGPEHSSARLERFLQLCAQDNLQVCIPTTPAQQFHLLRRQIKRNWRKPLIIMTPKSLLRRKEATSELNELSIGSFQTIIHHVENNASFIKRVILCSGKIYYDLMASSDRNTKEVAIIRIEQLYPFPDQELKAILANYEHVSDIVWCQEEPANQGAWQWIRFRLVELLASHNHLRYAGRAEAAATAVGSPLRHEAEQQKLLKEALG